MLTKLEQIFIKKLKLKMECGDLDPAACQLIEIIERLESDRPKIDKFDMEFRWLSNFYLVNVEFEGKIYPSTEHAYQAAKTTCPLDRERIRVAHSPGKAKRLGNMIELRQNWSEEIRIAIMTDLNRSKFQDPELRKKLIATGTREIIEGNNWNDTFWGVCGGAGRNELGKILMKIREECVGES